jgi:hypothetical protein
LIVVLSLISSLASRPNALVGLFGTFGDFFFMATTSSAFGQLKWLQALRERPMIEFKVMDEASRGPWETFLLLVRQTGGYVYSSHIIGNVRLDSRMPTVKRHLLTLHKSCRSPGSCCHHNCLGSSTFFQQALSYETLYFETYDATMPIARYMNGSRGLMFQIPGDPETPNVESKRRGLEPWTTNILASFFHGFDERPLRGSVHQDEDSMDEEARSLMMEFLPHEAGGGCLAVFNPKLQL